MTKLSRYFIKNWTMNEEDFGKRKTFKFINIITWKSNIMETIKISWGPPLDIDAKLLLNFDLFANSLNYVTLVLIKSLHCRILLSIQGIYELPAIQWRYSHNFMIDSNVLCMNLYFIQSDTICSRNLPLQRMSLL